MPSILRARCWIWRANVCVTATCVTSPCWAQAGSVRGSFDRIMALNILHEIDDADLRNIRRLLKPDGFVLFIDWNASIPRQFGPEANQVYTTAEAEDRLTPAGVATTGIEEARLPYHCVIRAGQP